MKIWLNSDIEYIVQIKFNLRRKYGEMLIIVYHTQLNSPANDNSFPTTYFFMAGLQSENLTVYVYPNRKIFKCEPDYLQINANLSLPPPA